MALQAPNVGGKGKTELQESVFGLEPKESLLHEMVHQWQDESGHTIDHGATFRAKARAVGIAPYARRVLATRPGRGEGSQTLGRRAARKG